MKQTYHNSIMRVLCACCLLFLFAGVKAQVALDSAGREALTAAAANLSL